MIWAITAATAMATTGLLRMIKQIKVTMNEFRRPTNISRTPSSGPVKTCEEISSPRKDTGNA
jgi:hypothetical protein